MDRMKKASLLRYKMRMFEAIWLAIILVSCSIAVGLLTTILPHS